VDSARARKAAHAQRRDGGFGAAGHHHVGIAVLDHARRQADACRPVVQAVTMARLGPLKPKRIDTWPEIMLMIEAGTKNGEMRRGPRPRIRVRRLDQGRPPMPEPIMQPMRSACSGQRLARGQARIGHRLRRGQAQVDEAVHVAGFLAGM
jgi:hypothetical protein